MRALGRSGTNIKDFTKLWSSPSVIFLKFMVCRVRYCFLNIYDRKIRLHNIMHRIPPPHCTHCIAPQTYKKYPFQQSTIFYIDNAYLIILTRLFCQMGRGSIYSFTPRQKVTVQVKRKGAGGHFCPCWPGRGAVFYVSCVLQYGGKYTL